MASNNGGNMRFILCFTSCVLCLSGSVIPAAAQSRVILPANKAFTDTGVDLNTDEPFRITASGEIEITGPSYMGRDGFDWRVGPMGSYRHRKTDHDKVFPLPSADKGPAPGYCLIGKIGDDGTPFFVGKDHYSDAHTAGRLYLGINDFDLTDNTGSFVANIAVGDEAAPPEERPDNVVYTAAEMPAGLPVPDARVVLLYVDGLRYDVLRDMAMGGYLPAIKELFFDGGTDFVNAFTVFPSSTLASNATLYTGVFNNRSGIKGNNWFDRKRRKADTYLEPFGPPIATDELRPAGLRHLGIIMEKAALFPFPGARSRYEDKRSNDVLLLADYLRDQGLNYSSTSQPILSSSPPNRYEVDASTVIPPFYFHRAKDYGDEINARFGDDLVLRPDAKIMNFWFPNVDTTCHDSPRAQFGAARVALANLDSRIGAIKDKLIKKKVWDRTYLFLFADHGTMGGKGSILQKVDLGKGFFYKSIADADNDHLLDPGSGMGCNIRWYDDYYTRKGRKKNGFVFVDYGEGEARVYLPYGDVDSGEWLRRNTLYDLTQYAVAPGYAPVNLVERLLALDMGDKNLFPEKVPGHPVAQVLVKLDNNRVAVFGQEGTQAIIERRAEGNWKFLYRYIPARGIRCGSDGKISFEETADADPLGYIKAGISPDLLREYHTEHEWLDGSKYLLYPDAIVVIANQMFWDGILAQREQRFSPDMMLCAANGWSFERSEEPSGGHGYLLYPSMRIPLLVAGPNVRKGIMISDGARSADLAPTVLSLLRIPYNSERLDGKALRGFLKCEGEADRPGGGGSASALLARLPYKEEELEPGDLVAEYEKRKEAKKPESLVADLRYQGHNLEKPTDIHVIAGEIFGLFNREALVDLDNLFDLAYPGNKKKPIETGLAKLTEGYDKLPDSYPKERCRELMHALQIKELTYGDAPAIILMSPTGAAGRGAAFRVTLLLEWIEHIFSDMDRAMLYPIRDKNIRVVSNVNYLLAGVRITVDKVSWGLTHYVGKALYDGIYHIEKADEKVVRAVKNQQ